LCVRQDARGQGIGTQLLQFCEAKIQTISPNIFICVSAFNKSALQLYLRVGFEIVGELPNFVKQGFTEILLRKTTGPVLGYQPPNQQTYEPV
jgi:ribosomal protein S18 acetylase RimI-like enzyme